MRKDRIDVCFLGYTLDTSDSVEYPTSVGEMNNILKRMNDFGICLGGPLIAKYEGINTTCAEKDYNSQCWRHNSCPVCLPIKGAVICVHCNELNAVFKQKQKRQESRVKDTPRTKARKLGKQVNYLSRVNIQLRAQIEELREKMCQLDESVVTEKLAQLEADKKISPVQVC